ncbi:MAG: hypothetical protein SFV81_03310 [Pirellulaceae bacterium]|nr:hypothetical protein [Pirellulaceae bacterium]
MLNRREFAQSTASLATASLAAAGALSLGTLANSSHAQAPPATKVTVELPRARVPLSFIIDDSTCLVNMGKFCMPQFASALPERDEYKKPWREWPSEIPDSFVRDFGSWCAEHDVRGKFSIVPYPACVGWLDRELPGWSRRDLQASLQLVRELMLPRWDIHPEMITHTRVIDLKTGRPHAEISAATMENSFPQTDISVDQLTEYLAYALRILKNCDLPCEGITTPGGFGNKVKLKLPQAVFEAVRDVYGTELPHYFKYVSLGDESVLPRFENVHKTDGDTPQLTVNVPAGTGDWFGGWDGVVESQGHLYSSDDASSGRMVELIERRQPAVMLCHWPGLYCNGLQTGYKQFQKVVLALEQRFKDETRWMKISEIGRYWTAKEFTKIDVVDQAANLQAPYACADFTLQVESATVRDKVIYEHGGQKQSLRPVASRAMLVANTYHRNEKTITVCFDLSKGASRLVWS